jgi:putative oxidoreductase
MGRPGRSARVMSSVLTWKGHAWISLPLRLYIGFVFLYACWHKILHPEVFAMDVATYQILPLYLVNLMAIVLPWIELVCGVLIVIGWRTRAASLLIAGMMAVFLAAIIMALAKGLEMSCGCFASQSMVEDPISWKTVLRDLGWLAIPLYVLVFDRNPVGVDGLVARAKRRRAHD